jgi:hypothetical protein
MPARFKIGQKVLSIRDNNAVGRTYPGKILVITKGTRSSGSGWNSEGTVCFFCLLDFLTCYRCQPDSLWTYTVKYDNDGYEEQQVPSTRLLEHNPVEQ